MGLNSAIEWTHHTFNPWWGCAKVSAGCTHCYADTFSARVGHGARLPQIWGVNSERKFFGAKHWAEPLKWNAKAIAAGERHRVFCASMADVFEDRADLVAPRAQLADLIDKTPALDWLLLTKRPENMLRLAAPFWPVDTDWPLNVWAGTTVEDQENADFRVTWLVGVPARVRFLSCEPLLGPIDLENIYPYYLKPAELRARGIEPSEYDPVIRLDCLRGHWKGPDDITDDRVHWVITGGESGPGARPMNLDWVRSLRDQCERAGVAHLFKQHGGVNKKSAGRVLDGRTYDGYPS